MRFNTRRESFSGGETSPKVLGNTCNSTLKLITTDPKICANEWKVQKFLQLRESERSIISSKRDEFNEASRLNIHVSQVLEYYGANLFFGGGG